MREYPQRAFRAAARAQRVCALCGKGGAFQAHHVVAKQLLIREGVPVWDCANALRLCGIPCHLGFENRAVEIPLTALVDENITYAYRVLGERAYDYLTNRYSGADARVALMEAA